MEGKIHSALRLLSEESQGGIHQLLEKILKDLCQQHPAPTEIQRNSLLFGTICDLRDIRFDIDEQKIAEAAQLTKGAAGPSSLDANQFKRILCSKQFNKEGKNLRDQISIFAKNIATKVTDPNCLEAYTANHLIPIDKNPGIRPIGIGEVLRRIVGKAIAWDLKIDFKEAAGPIQVCAGHQAGAEAAIDAMQTIFQEENTEGVLLIDASNAFNSMNRAVTLHNIQIICPRASVTLINTYHNPARLFIAGGGEILSREGTTQGDPLAMPFYAVFTSLLITILHQKFDCIKQVWLANDASTAGNLDHLYAFFNCLQEEGKQFGYLVNAKKSWLILKSSNDLSRAQSIFKDSKIQITTEGQCHLGAALDRSPLESHT